MPFTSSVNIFPFYFILFFSKQHQGRIVSKCNDRYSNWQVLFSPRRGFDEWPRLINQSAIYGIDKRAVATHQKQTNTYYKEREGKETKSFRINPKAEMRFSDEFDRQRGGKQAKQIEQISGCFALPL